MALWPALLRASTVREVHAALAACPPPTPAARLYFQHAPGGGGDALLAAAFLQRLASSSPGWRVAALPLQPLSAEEAAGSLAVCGGGGSLAPGGSGACAAFVQRCLAQHLPLLILPSTVRGQEALLRALPPTCILFCREEASRRHCEATCSGGAVVKVDHDLGLGLAAAPLLLPLPPPPCRAGAALWCFAPGTAPAAPPPVGATVQDLPTHFPLAEAASPAEALATAAAFLAAVAPFAVLHTNRLHVAIAAQRLNLAATATSGAPLSPSCPLRRIFLHDTPCGKNSAVYHASRALLPHVTLAPLAAQPLAAAAPAPPSLLLLYAPTRHATDAAAWVSSEACRLGVAHRVLSLAAYPIAALPTEARVVFFLSTWGDGDFPAPALPAWRFLLQATLPPTSLATLRFSVVGLGDSSYTKFNAAARKLSARLMQLGAQSLCQRCLADWQGVGSFVGAVDQWLSEHLWGSLGVAVAAGAAAAGAAAEERPLQPRWRVQEVEAAAAVVGGGGAAAAEALDPFPWPLPPFEGLESSSSEEAPAHAPLAGAAPPAAAPPQPFIATCTGNLRLTAPTWTQDVRHLSFSQWQPVSDPHTTPAAAAAAAAAEPPPPGLPQWQAGDVAVVFVENPPALVAALAAWLGLSLHCTLSLELLRSSSSSEVLGDERLCSPVWACAAHGAMEPPFLPLPLPPRVTVRALLARYLDIAAVPSRAALRQLSLYARSSEEAAKLRELASPAGAGLYSEYCVGEARGWWEVLGDFPSLRPLPLPLLLELMPRLAPRHYSAASACLAAPQQQQQQQQQQPLLELCIARLCYKTRVYGRARRGVASQHLCDLAVGSRVGICMVRGALRRAAAGAAAGAAAAQPLIMIGPGTGIAPMRALVQEMAAAQGGCSSSNALYFGCRHAGMDDLYGEEFRAVAAEEGGVLGGGYFSAFSRDGSSKVYVQGLLAQNGEAVRRVLDGGGRVLLAGSATTGLVRGVREALVEILGGESGGGKEALAALERARRVVTEAW